MPKELLKLMANETNKNSRTDHKDDESCKEKTMAVTLKPCKVSGGLKKAKAECVRHAAKMDKTEKNIPNKVCL